MPAVDINAKNTADINTAPMVLIMGFSSFSFRPDRPATVMPPHL
jgi:hypothetical protein